MKSDPIRLRERLAELLARVDADPRLAAEMAQARREFFGADQPPYVDAHDRTAMDAAAQRFVEWFLVERPSAVLGTAPHDTLGDPPELDRPLAESRAGLFLVEAASDELRVRDLETGERLALAKFGLRLAPGDVLVGRLHPADDGEHVASTALSVLSGSPQVAVAFQRDVRALGLERRLNQAELEHLVFRSIHRSRTAAGDVEPARPLERIEADLQTLFEGGGLDDRFGATAVSNALRDAGEASAAVIGPLLDQLAFDSDVDLDRARELLLELSNAHRVAALRRDRPGPPAAPAQSAAPQPAAPQSAAPQPAPDQPRAEFVPRPGESLGEQLARRIEEGLASAENVDALFEAVEQLFGEAIEDPTEEEAGLDDGALDDGDLEPLVREFAWETGASADDEARLGAWIALQRKAPVPKLSVEYLDADDYLRYVLQVWIGAHPRHRAAQARAAFAAVERFLRWMVETQEIDVCERLEFARRVLIEPLDRLQDASLALSHGDQPPGSGNRLALLRVLGRPADELELEGDDGHAPQRVAADLEQTGAIEVGDLLLGALEPVAGDGRSRFVGAVVVVPAAAEHLLG